MTKTKKHAVETQATEVPVSETDLVKVADVHKEASDPLAVMSNSLAEIQVSLSLKIPSDLPAQHKQTMDEAYIARYREFASADATDRIIASLSVSLQAAAMTSLQYAAGAELPVRTQELNNAIRATRVVAELLQALDVRRGRGKQSVAVGQVTVESGGQAIVGNVKSEGGRSTKPEETENPNDDPSREKQ